MLDRYGVELIGAKLDAIQKAEDRELFKAAMQQIGLELPRSGYARSIEEAREVVREVRLPRDHPPLASRSAARAARVAWNPEELEGAIRWGLQQSPVGQVLVEESVIGWKEFELEVMRDLARQRGHRLLDRELRPDGRPHRRLDHGGARPRP